MSAAPKIKLYALMQLEADICDLSAMGAILADLLDENLTDVRDERSPNDNWQIMLTAEQMNMLAFAWNNVSQRADALQKRFYATLEKRGDTEGGAA